MGAQLDSNDQALDEVLAFFKAIPDFTQRSAVALRQAFDEVIDTERTGRWDIQSLEKTEKTYIGTKIEIVFRNEFGLGRGKLLDNLIAGHEVDTKFSLSSGWMIPNEAVGQLCLLVAANDESGKFDVGLIRANAECLTAGKNQDGKKSISSSGKASIKWIVNRGDLPRNFFLDLDPLVREQVFAQPSAKARIQTLFRLVQNRLVPRSAITGVGRGAQDPLKRAREAKEVLAGEGLLLLCANYQDDRAKMKEYGFPNADSSDWLCVRPVAR